MVELSENLEADLAAAADLQRAGDLDAARTKYRSMLSDPAIGDVGAVYVLHLLAVIVEDPQEKLALNVESLEHFDKAGPDAFPAAMKASLLANVGYSYRELNDLDRAQHWYREAQEFATRLPDDEYGRSVRDGVQRALTSLDAEISFARDL